MDSFSSNWPDFSGDNAEDGLGPYEIDHEDRVDMTPPASVGQDERRMQVRAYNHWAGELGDRKFPSIEDLEPSELHDFGPNSVLLDFSVGQEDPIITYLGDKLGKECGSTHPINRLSDVPSRSLLSRITDHYLQIIANEAPIGFEAEFVNHSGQTVLYRGILLPYSSDDDTIDFIYGVINWKELADQQTTDALLLELDHALSEDTGLKAPRHDAPMPEWADGPLDDSVLELGPVLELGTHHIEPADTCTIPEPQFAALNPPAHPPENPPEADMPTDLAGWLASARDLAKTACGAEDRSRSALYAAIGRAYDFALAAAASPVEYDRLVAQAGLSVQPRAPMTPLVKLVFGADYDKTRLTEYAAALCHAQRLDLPQGALAGYLGALTGGLKALVQAERDLRRPAGVKVGAARTVPRVGLARKLRKIVHRPLDCVAEQGSEFTLLLARRLDNGSVVLLGELGNDVALLEKVAKKII